MGKNKVLNGNFTKENIQMASKHVKKVPTFMCQQGNAN